MVFGFIKKRYRIITMADTQEEPQKPTPFAENEKNPHGSRSLADGQPHNPPKVDSRQNDTSPETLDEPQLSTQTSCMKEPPGFREMSSSNTSSSTRQSEDRRKPNVGEGKGGPRDVLPHTEGEGAHRVESKVQHSDPTAPQEKQTSSSLPDAERDQKIEHLQGELKRTMGSRRRRKEKLIEKEKEYDKLKKKHDIYQKDFLDCQDQYGKLKKKYDKAQETMDGQNSQITKLTETISLFGNRNTVTTRDDDYFEAEFSRLEGVIQQWVFRYFRGASDTKLQDFHPEVRKSLEMVIWMDKALPEPQVKIQEIEAFVTHQLVKHIFYQFPFGMPEEKKLNQHFDAVYYSLGGTDLEKRKWHGQTLDMITSDSRYEEYLRNGIKAMAKHLKNCLDIRVTGGVPELRDQGLVTIIEEAAKLSEEINRQISTFRLHYIELASPYDPIYMEDISGTLGDDEKEKSDVNENILVHKVLFPIIARYGFDKTGKQMNYDPVVVRKGKVTIMRFKSKE